VTGRAAVFLDRDGVLNERPAEHQYVISPAGLRWLPGARDAVARLSRAGYPLIVVSNQRGIARGLLSWHALKQIENSMRADLESAGALVDAFYYCPHDLAERCGCRKPAPGLLLQAAAELQLDLRASVMIGDTEEDIEAGRAAGCVTIRLAEPGSSSAADLVLPDLPAAATAVLAGVTRLLPASETGEGARHRPREPAPRRDPT
jgi:D-glycero-D-manno-heptose 1,7-bisphosphate phosphatase